MVFCAGADEGSESLDGFEVVVEDVRAGIHDQLECPVAIVEIRDEDFDDDFRVYLADGADGFAEMLGSTVFQVVSGDGGDDDVLEVHTRGGLGDASRFVGLEGVGFGCFDGAETAGAGALVTGNHEGGGALSPALPAVWALSFFADGNELEIRDEGFRRPEGGVVG